MSDAETERFLKQYAATTPLPDGPGQGNLIGYEVLCKSVESYLKSIRAGISELPVELRPSESMQLYQARQTTVLEFWGFTAHATFPPPPKSEAAKYQAAALYRISILAAKHGSEDGTSTMNQVAQTPSTRQISQPSTPARPPIQISFRKPQTSTKARSYRKQASDHEESEEEQYQHSPKFVEGRESTAIPTTNTKLPQNSAACFRKDDEQSPKPSTRSDPQISPDASPHNLHLPASKSQPTKPLSTVTGATIYSHPVPPIWPAIKLQDGWDSLTGFPSGSFAFSTNKAFPRIVGPIVQGFGEIIGSVNHMFPLLRLRWERTPMKADGRRDLAVWVELGFGVSRTDPDALAQKQIMIEGLQEFHHKDLAGSQDYFGTYFEKNIERLRAEVRISSTDTTSMRRR